MRKLLLALLLMVTDLGWWNTSTPSHVAHCTRSQNQHTCRIVFSDGRDAYVFDSFLPWWCHLSWSSSGEARTRPLQLLVVSTDPSLGCVPSGSSFGTGAGYREGYWWATPPAYVREAYVFPRSASQPWSRGFMIEIY